MSKMSDYDSADWNSSEGMSNQQQQPFSSPLDLHASEDIESVPTDPSKLSPSTTAAVAATSFLNVLVSDPEKLNDAANKPYVAYFISTTVSLHTD